MSKWFESKNLANYAKTALLQAQKRIDQVLDIKEDEILASSGSGSDNNNQQIKPSITNDDINLNLTSPSVTVKDKQQLIDNKQQTTEADFFSSFLNHVNNSNSNTRSNSPSLASCSNVANLEDFKSSNRKLNKSKTSSSSAPAITLVKPVDSDTISFDNFVNSKEQDKEDLFQESFQNDTDNIFNLKSVSATNLVGNEPSPIVASSKPSSNKLGRTSSSSSTKTTKNQQQSQQNSQTELEKIEKKNWIQNYVDSDGCNSGILSESSSVNFIPPITHSQPSLQSQPIVEDDSNKTVISETTNNEDIKDDMLASINNTSFTEINKITESCHSSSSTTATNNNIATDQLLIETSSSISLSSNIKVVPVNEDLKLISFTNEKEQANSISPTHSSSSNESFDETKPNEENKTDNRTCSMIDMEYVKVEGSSGSDSANGGNKGGCSSLSGNSQSGHASSAEEQETCASSDIEVISLPSNSGDQLLATLQQKANNHFQSPLTIIKNKKQRQNKQTNDSSPTAESASLSLHPQQPISLLQQPANSQFISNSNVMQIYVKSPPPPLVDSTDPQQTSSSQQSLLEAREAQILKLNKQTVRLQEENDNLVNEIEKFRFETLERFKTMQLAQNELNTRCEQFYSENEKLKRINNDLNKEFVEMQKQIKEKDEQIEQLKQEGLKLSKQELNQSNIIKKLRSKEKENEESLTILKNDLLKSNKELDDLKKVLDSKEETEKVNSEAFKKLEKGAFYLEKELVNAKAALEDSHEKVTSLENTLQNTFKELAELHRLNAAKDSRINEATSSIENQLKEEIQTAVDKERSVWQKKQETLKWEMQSVRSDVSRLEHQHSLREDMLRKEIADLQQQLRDTEMRNNELSQNVSTATRPLLRQIENLQASHSSQIELLENAERNLIERLKESQANCADLTEKNRHNKEQLIEMTQQIKIYEAQLNTLKSEKSKLTADYQMAKSNLDSYENEKFEKETQNRVIIGSLNQQIEKMTREKKSLEAQLDIEKQRVENDSKKLQNLMNELAKERELQQQQQKKIMNSSTSSIDSNSTTTSESAATAQAASNSTSFMRRVSSNHFDMSSNTRYDLMQSVQSSGAFSILEGLQSKLKQKDGEINQLQKEIHNLEKIRESMAKELITLSNKMEYMQQQLKEYPSLQENFNKLNTEYNALLQMYGEKSEETEELKLDLQDVKEMYRLQIEDLIKRSNLS